MLSFFVPFAQYLIGNYVLEREYLNLVRELVNFKP